MRFFLGLTAMAAVSSVAGSAYAQTCNSDSDCPQSFTCVEAAVSLPGSTTPACPPNTDCGKVAPPPETTTPTVIKYCQAKACIADANCGPGMVCRTESFTTCSGGSAVAPCPPDMMCGRTVPPDMNCVTKTVSACAFKWQLPCNTAADCGDGFNCKPSVTVSCPAGTGTATPVGSGGGTAPSAGADPAPPATDLPLPRPAPADGGTTTDCTTKESFPGYCEPRATTCTMDSDCPAYWKCTDVNAGTPASGGPTREASPPTGSSSGGGTPSSGDPAPGVPADMSRPVPTPSTVKACTSPYGVGVRATDTANGTPTASPQPGGGTVPPTAGGGMNPESTTPPAKGCAISPTTPGASAFALAALLGLLIARRRK